MHEMNTTTFELKEVARMVDRSVGSHRISDSCLNPERTRCLTAGSDQTVKIWSVFGQPKQKGKKKSVFRDSLNFR